MFGKGAMWPQSGRQNWRVAATVGDGFCSSEPEHRPCKLTHGASLQQCQGPLHYKRRGDAGALQASSHRLTVNGLGNRFQRVVAPQLLSALSGHDGATAVQLAGLLTRLGSTRLQWSACTFLHAFSRMLAEHHDTARHVSVPQRRVCEACCLPWRCQRLLGGGGGQLSSLVLVANGRLLQPFFGESAGPCSFHKSLHFRRLHANGLHVT
ncbi:hypothetical protein WJX73_004506 [Symbiochloris irregularis]|uniref:Uncharacterized protein n=1 Tax=Symbiochloris irregularis TaxID=706552 RepID=A0AAW1PG12_9CHLO